MARFNCPACGGNQISKATRPQRRAFPKAGPWDDIRACGNCGRLFEVPWAPWITWFCLICGWITLLAGALLVVSVLGVNKDANAAVKVLPIMVVPLFILPAAYRQRRLRRRRTDDAGSPPPGGPS